MERTQTEPAREASPVIHLVEIRDGLDGILEGYTTAAHAEERIIFAAGMDAVTLDKQMTTPDGTACRVVRFTDRGHSTVFVFGAKTFPLVHAYGLLLLLARRIDERPIDRPFASLQLYAAINVFSGDATVRVLLRDLAPTPNQGESTVAYAVRLRAVAEALR